MDETEYKRAFGQHIKNIRSSMKLTQQEFCALIDIEVSNLSNIENGKAYPSIPTLRKMSDKLNLTPNELLNIDVYNCEETVTNLINHSVADLTIEQKIIVLKTIRLFKQGINLKNK